MTKRNTGQQNPDLTEENVNEIFSDVLKELLNDGYTFIYENDDVWVDCSKKVFLKKDESHFVLVDIPFFREAKKAIGSQLFTSDYAERRIVLISFGNSRCIDKKTMAMEQSVFYTYYKVNGCGQYGDKELYYTTETPAKTIAYKKLERDIHQKWLDKGYLMVLKLKNTPFVGFRKNVTVKICKGVQIVENANGKRVYIEKFSSGLYCFDRLKKA